jgi:hypothetical protein
MWRLPLRRSDEQTDKRTKSDHRTFHWINMSPRFNTQRLNMAGRLTVAVAVAVAATGMTGVAVAGTQATNRVAKTSSPQMLQIAFFAGSWRATGTFFATPFNPTSKPIRMAIRTRLEDGDSWLVQHTAETATAENPNPLSAHYLWGYNSACKVFTADWFDSNGGRATQTSQGWEGDKLTFTGHITYGDRVFPLQDIFVKKGKTSYYHRGQVDFGQGWQAVDEENVFR